MVGTAIGVGLSLINSSNQSDAAQQSAQTQANSAAAANQTQLNMYNQTQANQTPWLNSGTTALNNLDYLLGLTPQAGQAPTNGSTGPGGTSTTAGGTTGGYSFTGGNPTSPYDPTQGVNKDLGAYGSLAKPFSQADFVADPGYQFSLGQGEQAIQNSAASKGGLYSGAAMKALQSYGQGTAAQEYQDVYNRYNQNQTNLFNRLSGVAGTGQTAANQLATTGANAANAISNNQTSAGAALGAGQVGSANAWSTGLSNVGNYINQGINANNSSVYNPNGTYNASNIIWN